MRTMLVIGAGRFGGNLAVDLTEQGSEVLLVDENEEAVSKFVPLVTRVQIGDCMDVEVLRSLGVRDFDVCFVCISDNFQSSLEITSLLKDQGARYVVSKTDRDLHADLLKRIGADEVVYPERDMARRTAMRFSARGAFDYIELSDEYAIMELAPPAAWIGRQIREVDVRGQYKVNVLGVRTECRKIDPLVSAEHVFQAGEHLIVAGTQRELLRLMDKK